MHLLGNIFLKGLLQVLGYLLIITGINAILVTVKINNALMAGWCGNESSVFFSLSHCAGCLQVLLGFTVLAFVNRKVLASTLNTGSHFSSIKAA